MITFQVKPRKYPTTFQHLITGRLFQISNIKEYFKERYPTSWEERIKNEILVKKTQDRVLIKLDKNFAQDIDDENTKRRWDSNTEIVEVTLIQLDHNDN